MFKKIIIENWRQYERIDIDFHPRLTILTGANGAGKTTLLNILDQHFGWNIGFVSTPERDKEKGILRYFTGIIENFFSKNKNSNIHQGTTTIGNIFYDNGIKCDITVPNNVSYTYNVQLYNMASVRGLCIPSHRTNFNYRSVSSIPTTVLKREQIYQKYNNIVRNKYLDTFVQESSTSAIKEALISLATFGYGNNVVASDKNAIKMFEDFQRILQIVLPPNIGFESISIQVPEVVLVTKSGNFSIDAVSGGIASIIDLAWQIFMFDDPEKNFVVTIDEPENHLHPEMQRSLLVNLLEAFPNVQFIVASHNPFIVSSVPDSNVYVLNYNENNRVNSIWLDTINKSGTSNDVLRDVLGVPTTMPIWAEHKLNEIIEKFSNLEISEQNIKMLRSEMSEIGFEKLIPDTIVKVVERGINK